MSKHTMYVSKAYSAYEDGESHRVVDTTVQIDEDLWRNKMQPDINQPIENPKLKDLISDLRKADNAHFAAVNEAIAEEIAMNAFMLAVMNTDGAGIENNNDGTATIKKDTVLSFEFLADGKGRTFLPVFTDWDELRKWDKYKDSFVQTLVLSFDDMSAITAGKNGIAVNPFSDNYVISAENVLSMKRHKEVLTKGFSEEVVKKDTKVQIGDPADYPAEMAEAIRRYAEKNKGIRAIWLKLMIKEGEKSYLLIVDADDAPACFNGIGEAANPYIGKGMFLDMVPYNSEFGRKAAAGKPFYKRSKGMFDIFKK